VKHLYLKFAVVREIMKSISFVTFQDAIIVGALKYSFENSGD